MVLAVSHRQYSKEDVIGTRDGARVVRDCPVLLHSVNTITRKRSALGIAFLWVEVFTAD